MKQPESVVYILEGCEPGSSKASSSGEGVHGVPQASVVKRTLSPQPWRLVCWGSTSEVQAPSVSSEASLLGLQPAAFHAWASLVAVAPVLHLLGHR